MGVQPRGKPIRLAPARDLRADPLVGGEDPSCRARKTVFRPEYSRNRTIGVDEAVDGFDPRVIVRQVRLNFAKRSSAILLCGTFR
jgi:hypothetical protein